MNEKRKYDSTVARIAGNIASLFWYEGASSEVVARDAVKLARAIVAEVEHTEPVTDYQDLPDPSPIMRS